MDDLFSIVYRTELAYQKVMADKTGASARVVEHGPLPTKSCFVGFELVEAFLQGDVDNKQSAAVLQNPDIVGAEWIKQQEASLGMFVALQNLVWMHGGTPTSAKINAH